MSKNTSEVTQEANIVLVYIDNKPGFFARVEEILPDIKPGWWQVRLLPLAIDNLDYKTLVWILDESQIRGAEYTMSGIPMRLENIPPHTKPKPEAAPEDAGQQTTFGKTGKKGNVVSFTDRRK